MVEFALFFLLFLTMMVGLMEGGRMIWTYTTLAYAARQGARYAMVHGSGSPVGDDKIEAVVERNAVGLDPDSLSVNTQWAPDNQPGSVVAVRVRYDLNLVAAPLFLSQSNLTLGSTSRMVITY